MAESFDKLYAVETGNCLKKEEFDSSLDNIDSAYMYKPTLPDTFSKIMQHIPASVKKGRFIDFGSGKGRALILAYEAGYQHVTGVEFEPSLCQQARENLVKAELNYVEIIEQDAAAYPVPEDSTLFYFYNPFNIRVLEKVLANIVDSISHNPREAYIVYAMPNHTEAFYPDRFTPIAANESEAEREYIIYAIKRDVITPFEKAMMKLKRRKKLDENNKA